MIIDTSKIVNVYLEIRRKVIIMNTYLTIFYILNWYLELNVAYHCIYVLVESY